MTPFKLAQLHKKHNPDSCYFTPQNMRFFGDSWDNYGVRKYGENWELYRRKPVAHGYLWESEIFCGKTFKQLGRPEEQSKSEG